MLKNEKNQRKANNIKLKIAKHIIIFVSYNLYSTIHIDKLEIYLLQFSIIFLKGIKKSQ